MSEAAIIAPLVRLEKVSKAYSDAGQLRSVLTGVSAQFSRGAFIAIQGRSGSGKSTLLNLLAGIDLPDSGEVLIDNQVINRQNEQQRTRFRRRHVGFVFQSFNLIPTLTIAENLLLPLELNGVADELSSSKVEALLNAFSLADKGQSYPDRLSGGEQQRVAIARAIIHNPALVLADEPTGNLDADTERQTLELLQRLPAEHNITVITATHSAEIARVADQVYWLDSGTLVSQ